ncbi:MAG: hypothetical protein IID36_12415, partial [Planctomycetes bacterium]|nr:hypothetical protein [Planctomycetota bacterium]
MQRFRMVTQRAILATATFVALHPPPARAQCEVQKLTAAGSEQGDSFGAGVAVSGDWAVVGAPGAGFLSRGIAYVYRRHGVTWVEEAHFSPPEIHSNSNFGSTVAIMGDVAAVGDTEPGPFVGGEPVRIYRRTDSGTPDDPGDDTWFEQAELLPSDPGLSSAYGAAISIDGERIIIGDPLAGPSPAGAVFIFRRDENDTPNDPTDDTWVEEAKLASPAESPFSNFGNAVALNGALLLVGNLNEECGDGPGCGAAYVYRRDDNDTPSDPDDDNWILEAKLTPRQQFFAQSFGSSVDIADGIAIVGAASQGFYPGAVYVFEQIDGNWVETNKLLASDGDVVDRFGESIWLGESLIMVGAPKLDDHGAAYLFRKIDDAWVEEVKFLATDPAMGDDFGETISVSGQWGLGSVPGDEDGGDGEPACTCGSA